MYITGISGFTLKIIKARIIFIGYYFIWWGFAFRTDATLHHWTEIMTVLYPRTRHVPTTVHSGVTGIRIYSCLSFFSKNRTNLATHYHFLFIFFHFFLKYQIKNILYFLYRINYFLLLFK